MTLLKRILTEKRAVVFPLLFALLVNVAVYALVVYPLNRRACRRGRSRGEGGGSAERPRNGIRRRRNRWSPARRAPRKSSPRSTIGFCRRTT